MEKCLLFTFYLWGFPVHVFCSSAHSERFFRTFKYTDMDKKVNRRLDHLINGIVLRTMAARITRQLRLKDGQSLANASLAQEVADILARARDVYLAGFFVVLEAPQPSPQSSRAVVAVSSARRVCSVHLRAATSSSTGVVAAGPVPRTAQSFLCTCSLSLQQILLLANCVFIVLIHWIL